VSEWTEEVKTEVIEKYKEANPTPETSSEIIDILAEEYDKTVNGIRMILVKNNVYVKKEQTKANGEAKKSTRISKADALDSLTEAIESNGCEVDDSVISKLTGKAATYFAEVINKVAEAE
jgi:hypothetical protein